jgi:predicted RNA binding protein YcfA (HicA-like mRNA interferase family)
MPKIAGINHLDAVRALEKAGFQIVRQASTS